MHIIILTILNIVNACLFWVMWGGFYVNHEDDIFYNMLGFSLVPVFLAITLYTIRSKPIAIKLISFKLIRSAVNKNHFAYVTSLVGSYFLSSIYIIVVPIVFLILGGIDIWILGKNT
jgi:hypothetical protein